MFDQFTQQQIADTLKGDLQAAAAHSAVIQLVNLFEACVWQPQFLENAAHRNAVSFDGEHWHAPDLTAAAVNMLDLYVATFGPDITVSLHIKCTGAEKAAMIYRAAALGKDLTAYLLDLAAEDIGTEFQRQNRPQGRPVGYRRG